ncbi:MAG TPA: pitrilysin family protein [Vicinamibacterales bacterium]|jgi:predicted Zn-dependent peptidase|nr:pitrilysin family protein [Vicinamibacterales bacterium]
MKPFRVLAVLLLASTPAAAQDSPAAQPPTDFKGVVLKNKAPVSNDVLRVTFRRPFEAKLKNGMDLMVLEEHRSPTVQVEIAVPASTLYDPEGVPISAAMTSLMRLGTKTRDAKTIAETLAGLGASITFNVGDRYAYARFSTLTENLDAVLELTSDMLFNSTFPEEELGKWKNQQLSFIQQVRALPEFLAQERFAQAMYPEDRRSFLLPTPDGVARINRAMVLEQYAKVYRPERGRVTVLGDVSAKDIAPKLERLMASWSGKGSTAPELPLPPVTKGRRLILVNRPGSVQTVLYIGNHAIDRLSPDYIPVQVLNRVLGGGPASRLFRNIREDKGYTYGISSGFSASRYFNHFSSQTSVRTEVTADALREILKEFADIRTRPVPPDELQNAKRAVVAGFALSTENPGAALGNATQIKEYGLLADYWDTYPEKIAAVTAADVQRVAQKYIPLDDIVIVAVGDAAKIRASLATFGTLEEWDADGKRLPSN